jgi:transcriptional regulator
MYLPAIFREERPEILQAAMRDHPLATLVTHGPAGLEANLVPFILLNDPHGRHVLRAHLAIANPQIADLRRGTEALVIFQGPQAYISPTWYPTKQEHGKVVPTWNYVVVQAWGRPQVIDDADWLRAQVCDLTNQQEQHQAAPWSLDDAPPAYIAAQLKAIVGVEIPIDRLEGKWKTSQNQPAINRCGVVAGLSSMDPKSPMAALIEKSGQRD